MKKFLLLLILFPLFGITPKPEVVEKKYIKDPRPTLEQQLQLSNNKIKEANSKISVSIAEIKYNY